jgi:hypothetical protein
MRVSAYWDEVDARGYGPLDEVLHAAAGAGVRLVVTIGMKAMRWPEFWIPEALKGRRLDDLRGPVVEFVTATTERYRGVAELVAWQVENEPFNRSGPARRVVPDRVLAAELEAVRALDTRPVVINAFRRYTLMFDLVSRRWPWEPAEARVLRLLSEGDVLGLDLYPAIEVAVAGWSHISRPAGDWAERAGRLRARALAAGRRCWVIEAQAEPWGPGIMDAEGLTSAFSAIERQGFEHVLLWGGEHWLWSEARGDATWLRAVDAILQRYAG